MKHWYPNLWSHPIRQDRQFFIRAVGWAHHNHRAHCRHSSPEPDKKPIRDHFGLPVTRPFPWIGERYLMSMTINLHCRPLSVIVPIGSFHVLPLFLKSWTPQTLSLLWVYWYFRFIINARSVRLNLSITHFMKNGEAGINLLSMVY